MLLVQERQWRIGGTLIWIGLGLLGFMAYGAIWLVAGDCFESVERCDELWALGRQQWGLTLGMVLITAIFSALALRSRKSGRQLALLIASAAWIVLGLSILIAPQVLPVWIHKGLVLAVPAAIFLGFGSVLRLDLSRDTGAR